MKNIKKQSEALNIDDHFKWEEETEIVTIELNDYDVKCKSECTFHFEDGEGNHGIPKPIFSHLDSKCITVLDIFPERFTEVQKFEIEKILNNKL